MIETSTERKKEWLLSHANPHADHILHITRVGHNTAKEGYSIGPRVQGGHCILFIMQGSLHFNYEHTSVQLHAGDIFYLVKDQRYSYKIAKSNLPLQKIWIGFQGSQIEWLQKQTGLIIKKPFRRHAIRSDSKLLLQFIIKVMKEQNEPDPLLLLGLFFQLLSALNSVQGLNQTQSIQDWADHAKNYIDIHYNERINLDDVCKHVSVSRGHFSEVFVQRFGVSPSRYLMKLRMDRAMHLILNTTFTITEIAHSTGYQSLFSFSRAFRSYFGFSPNHVRMKH